jgi:hypothetical protein
LKPASPMLPFLFLILAASNTQNPIFREVPAAESGITGVHQNGRSEHRYLPETTGAGVASLVESLPSRSALSRNRWEEYQELPKGTHCRFR